ncbi:FAD-dependent oxidoreductase [Mycolicibacterium brisbanense]|nr:FAD-dependent monooxygenase [Mycolicibacterium brisbanense]MCV7156770.1 FAD-dependent monooxygenase [Mycolicibacterium brisbanense]
MEKLGDHALVLGGSMAGLLAARVLSDFYETVTIVERDELGDDPVYRRGVPQGRLIHALSARGAQILDELFPSFLDELAAEGVPSWCDGDFSKLSITIGGHQMVRSGKSVLDPITMQYPSRRLLERDVRRRVRDIANVTTLDGHDLLALTATSARDRVTGARVTCRSTGHESALTADLVVDATGRGSRTPVFLEELGFGRPRQNELMVQLAYVAQLLRIPKGVVEQYFTAVMPVAGRPRMLGLIGYENDTWMFAVGGMAGLEPPRQLAEMLQFVEDFAPAALLDAVRDAEPLGDVVHYRVPSNRWRRYDTMHRVPDGLLVCGDAVCSFNPIYGQGMTIAAVEALVLRDCLSRGTRNLPRRFYRAGAKKVRLAWQTAVGSDLALPEVAGSRPVSMRISNGYLEKVMTAAETDPDVAQQFLRVVGMIDGPTRLLRPGFVGRVVKANRHRQAHDVMGLPESMTTA